MADEKTEEIDALAQKLNKIAELRQFDEGNDKQAEIVAEGLIHISESLTAFQDLFDRLRQPGLTEEEQLDLLWDIGEELRHIDEHTHDMAYFDSQINESEDGNTHQEKLDS